MPSRPSAATPWPPARRPPIRALLVIAAAFTLALPPNARSGTRPVPPFWWALGSCETGHIGLPSDGPPRFDWGRYRRPLEGTTYEGFVGFAATTWHNARDMKGWADILGLSRRYPHAWQAPPMVQVRVARYGLSVGGYWGCLHSHPEIYSLPGR